MTTLRQTYIRELVIRGMSPRTQQAYVQAVYYLAKHYHRSPDQLGNEEIKNYLYYLAKREEAFGQHAQPAGKCVSFSLRGRAAPSHGGSAPEHAAV